MDNVISTKTLTGAKVIIETLKNLGVDTIFGYPGGIVLKIYDELYNQKDIKHILVRHEQSAVHAAEGYARVSGKTGVVLVTSGPGATNTVSGIVNAYLDGFPLIVLTGQVDKNLIGKDAFQEANICDITKSCTKKTYQVTSAKDLEKTLIEAYDTAMSGKKGPVVVDLAKNIFYEETEFANLSANIYHSNITGDINLALSEICNAKYPVIVAGGGSVGAYEELREFAQKLNIPVVNTMMGTGIYPFDDKNYMGMVGIFGDKSANQIIKDADLIISVGARFNDRITCCLKELFSKKFIQIDINSSEISRVIKATHSIVGDAKEVLTKFITNFDGTCQNIWTDEKLAKLKTLNIQPQKQTNILHSFEVMEEVQKYFNNKNITVTTEVGQHQLWAVKNLKFKKPLQFLTSGGSGTMGFGLPSAIGASIAEGFKPVLCIAGDGSFQMTMNELATCVDYKLPIKILVMNNNYLGMVRQLQENQCGGRYSETKISNPDFLKIAESYGIKGYQIHSKSEVLPTLEKAFAVPETVIIECLIEPMEMV